MPENVEEKKERQARMTVKSAIGESFPNADEELLTLLQEGFKGAGITTALRMKKLADGDGRNIIQKAFYRYALRIGERMLKGEQVDEGMENYINIYAQEHKINRGSLLCPSGAPLLMIVIHQMHDNQGIETIRSKFDK